MKQKSDVRMTILRVFFGAFAVAIASRAVWLQVWEDPRLARLSQRQFKTQITALPRRGLILDRNGEGLAISIKARSLFIRPRLLGKEYSKRERQRLMGRLAHATQIPAQQLSQKFFSNKGFVWIKRQLSENEEKNIRDSGLLGYGDGIGLVEESRRFYPNAETASHVLGSVNIDGEGIEGLELKYQSILSGEQQKIDSTKDAMGRRIFESDEGTMAFKDGQSLILTIDKGVQYEVERYLKQAIEDQDAKAGTAIVANAETGEIISMANYPTYNPNQIKGTPVENRRNRAITDTFEPGSTFKPLVIGMALEKGKKASHKIYCEKGSFKIGKWKISEAEAHEKFEWLTLSEILKVSSNVGTAKLALELGPHTMSQLYDKLALGSRTGIDLPGEVGGLARKNDLKVPIHLANVGFGHGITVSAIQMLSYYLALANGGQLVQPKLVKAVISEDPEALEKGALRYKIQNLKQEQKTVQLFSPEIAKSVSQMLETVTQDSGTGAKAQIAEWPVAGKTGTAQKIDPVTKRYSRSRYIASFAGFAPAKNPHLVAIVVMDEPKKHYYASETAAPAFREIMKAAMLREGIAPVDSEKRIQQIANKSVISTMEEETKSLSTMRQSAVSKIANELKKTEEPTIVGSQVRVPDLRGMSVREALRTLGAVGLNAEITGQGILKDQKPSSDTWAMKGSTIELHFNEER